MERKNPEELAGKSQATSISHGGREDHSLPGNKTHKSSDLQLVHQRTTSSASWYASQLRRRLSSCREVTPRSEEKPCISSSTSCCTSNRSAPKNTQSKRGEKSEEVLQKSQKPSIKLASSHSQTFFQVDSNDDDCEMATSEQDSFIENPFLKCDVPTMKSEQEDYDESSLIYR